MQFSQKLLLCFELYGEEPFWEKGFSLRTSLSENFSERKNPHCFI